MNGLCATPKRDLRQVARLENCQEILNLDASMFQQLYAENFMISRLRGVGPWRPNVCTTMAPRSHTVQWGLQAWTIPLQCGPTPPRQNQL